MNKKIIASSLLLLGIIGSVADAASSSPTTTTSGIDLRGPAGYYISGSGGLTWAQDQYGGDFTTNANAGISSGSGFTTTYDLGWNGSMSIGVKLRHSLRLEGQITYLENKIDEAAGDSSNIDSSSKQSGVWYGVNFIRDVNFLGDTSVVPYLGVGLGAVTIKTKYSGSFPTINSNQNLSASNTATAPAWQTTAGIGYQFGSKKKMRVFGEFRHIGSSKIKTFDDDGASQNTYYQANLFDIGFAYFFG